MPKRSREELAAAINEAITPLLYEASDPGRNLLAADTVIDVLLDIKELLK